MGWGTGREENHLSFGTYRKKKTTNPNKQRPPHPTTKNIQQKTRPQEHGGTPEPSALTERKASHRDIPARGAGGSHRVIALTRRPRPAASPSAGRGRPFPPGPLCRVMRRVGLRLLLFFFFFPSLTQTSHVLLPKPHIISEQLRRAKIRRGEALCLKWPFKALP